ncbi:MAG: hypothetical protein JRF63_13175 [Deltaproteobacteria bacterium]|nr:hypothetical protein [Deltaproteobacteria bacterium]
MKTTIALALASLFGAIPCLANAETLTAVARTAVESPDDAWNASRPKPKLTIRSSTNGSKWMNKRALNVSKTDDVVLKVNTAEGAEVRWYMIFADITRFYQNANHPWEENAYGWTGLEKIAYHRVEIHALRGQREVRPLAEVDGLWDSVATWFREAGVNEHLLDFYRAEAGTFWFQAEEWRDGALAARSPGIEDADDRGISTRVIRIAVRSGDDYLGHLEAFFNVPGVFGSILYQSKNHIGADCADVLMAAWAKWKKRRPDKNYNVQMLVGKFKKRLKTVIDGGNSTTEVRWGEDVFPGDFIAVNYDDSKRYHHIGALYADRNGNGLLDADDIVLHAGPAPLHFSTLGSGVFDGDVVILKP